MALPETGLIYNPYGDAIRGTLASPWSQPNGRWTEVFPQQYDSAAGEFEPPLIPYGMYRLGCGHASNILAIFKEYDSDTGEQVALICCPVCTFLQQIISPYATYQNYIDVPIVVA